MGSSTEQKIRTLSIAIIVVAAVGILACALALVGICFVTASAMDAVPGTLEYQALEESFLAETIGAFTELFLILTLFGPIFDALGLPINTAPSGHEVAETMMILAMPLSALVAVNMVVCALLVGFGIFALRNYQDSSKISTLFSCSLAGAIVSVVCMNIVMAIPLIMMCHYIQQGRSRSVASA